LPTGASPDATPNCFTIAAPPDDGRAMIWPEGGS